MTASLHDEFFERHLGAAPLMAIFRGLDPADTVSRAQEAWSAGAALVEVPVQDERGWESFHALHAVASGRSVGVGTVTRTDQVERAAEAGAAFCVAPGFDAVISRAAAERGLAHLPGVATGTEIGQAAAAGHRWVKAFPASVLGVEWIRAMRAPFPDARFVCTGGMTYENWPSFRAAGAHAVALGSGWVTPGVERQRSECGHRGVATE